MGQPTPAPASPARRDPIGLSPETPAPSTTLVTAYFDVPSKFPSKNYLAWARTLLSVRDPLVVFTNVEQIIDLLRELRGYSGGYSRSPHRRTGDPRPVGVSSVGLATKAVWFGGVDHHFLSEQMAGEKFWAEQVRRDPHRLKHKGALLYHVWHQKAWFLKEVAGTNPFGTKYFAWIDIGYLRSKPYLFGVRLVTRWIGVDDKTMLMLHVSGEQVALPEALLRRAGRSDKQDSSTTSIKDEKQLAANSSMLPAGSEKLKSSNNDGLLKRSLNLDRFLGGGFFGGTQQTVNFYTTAYYDTLKTYVRLTSDCFNDQHIMGEVCLDRRGLCDVISTNSSDWFLMADLLHTGRRVSAGTSLRGSVWKAKDTT